MGKILKSPAGRTITVGSGELLVTGAWAFINPQFVAQNASWFVAIGAIGLITSWFWDQVVEFRDWKRGATIEPVREWEPLHESLAYIARQSAWAFEVTPDTPHALNRLLQGVVAERLARGEISSRGIETERLKKDLSLSTRAITPEFWESAFFQPFGEIAMADETRCAATTDGALHQSNRQSYRQIILDKAQVRGAWPKATKKLADQENVLTIGLNEYYMNEFDDNGSVRRKMREASDAIAKA